MSATVSERAMPNEPLASPPYICASPTLRASAPPRKFAPKAVRPRRDGPTVTRAACEQAERRDVGREVERVRRQRGLKRLPAVVGVCHHAFGDIAVKLDI